MVEHGRVRALKNPTARGLWGYLGD